MNGIKFPDKIAAENENDRMLDGLKMVETI